MGKNHIFWIGQQHADNILFILINICLVLNFTRSKLRKNTKSSFYARIHSCPWAARCRIGAHKQSKNINFNNYLTDLMLNIYHITNIKQYKFTFHKYKNQYIRLIILSCLWTMMRVFLCVILLF